MKHLVGIAVVVGCLLSAVAAGAESVPEDERVPVVLRRTTLVVKDMDASLAFYRDAVGMKVLYDNTFRSPRDAKNDAEAESVIHLVGLTSF